MTKTHPVAAICAFVFGLSSPLTVFAMPVTVTSSTVDLYAEDLVENTTTDTNFAVPYTTTNNISSGNSSNATTINYSSDAVSAIFDYDFIHSIDNTTGDTSSADYVMTEVNRLYFTANGNSTYTIDGYYSMSGPSGTAIILGAFLFDHTAGAFLFWDNTQSRFTENESFTLGVAGDGDYYNNVLTGSLTGSLLDGHLYSFDVTTLIQAWDGSVTQVDTTATGSVSLSITTVPIPPAIWLFGSGLFGLIGVARQKKAA